MPPQPLPMPAASAILAVNIGSSSIKYAAYEIIRGTPDHIGRLIVSGNLQGIEPNDQSLRNGLHQFKEKLAESMGSAAIRAIAHRVVHGGERYQRAVIATPAVLSELHQLDRLAPLHQPHNLRGISLLLDAFPGVPQVACFDTAFHTTLPETEKAFGLTQTLYQHGLRRFGFHGLSYHYVSELLSQHSAAAKGRLLMAHLGNGASLCACLQGKSIATTMGFSTLGGLIMGTRCGDLDPGVLLYLLQEGMSLQELEDLLYRQSGLKGMSEISADMRALRENGSANALFAIKLFTARVIREAGGLIAAMGGVDAIAFTGGIGENDAVLRAEVCSALQCFGVEICPDTNNRAAESRPLAIHTRHSTAEVWVVKTDEGRVAAQEAFALL